MGKQGQEEKTGIKHKGSKLRERPKSGLNLGTENGLSHQQLVMVPLGPTSNGSLPVP